MDTLRNMGFRTTSSRRYRCFLEGRSVGLFPVHPNHGTVQRVATAMDAAHAADLPMCRHGALEEVAFQEPKEFVPLAEGRRCMCTDQIRSCFGGRNRDRSRARNGNHRTSVIGRRSRPTRPTSVAPGTRRGWTFFMRMRMNEDSALHASLLVQP